MPSKPIIDIHKSFDQPQIITLTKSLIAKNETKDVEALLNLIVSEPDNEEMLLSAINLLIWIKDENALNLSIKYSRENNKVCLHDPFSNFNLGIDVPDNYLLYDEINMLTSLMEYLELCLSFPNSESTSRRIKNNRLHLALLSEDNFKKIISSLEEFILNNHKKHEDVESLNFTIAGIRKQYEGQNEKKYTIRESNITMH